MSVFRTWFAAYTLATAATASADFLIRAENVPTGPPPFRMEALGGSRVQVIGAIQAGTQMYSSWVVDDSNVLRLHSNFTGFKSGSEPRLLSVGNHRLWQSYNGFFFPGQRPIPGNYTLFDANGYWQSSRTAFLPNHFLINANSVLSVPCENCWSFPMLPAIHGGYWQASSDTTTCKLARFSDVGLQLQSVVFPAPCTESRLSRDGEGYLRFSVLMTLRGFQLKTAFTFEETTLTQLSHVRIPFNRGELVPTASGQWLIANNNEVLQFSLLAPDQLGELSEIVQRHPVPSVELRSTFSVSRDGRVAFRGSGGLQVVSPAGNLLASYSGASLATWDDNLQLVVERAGQFERINVDTGVVTPIRIELAQQPPFILGLKREESGVLRVSYLERGATFVQRYGPAGNYIDSVPFPRDMLLASPSIFLEDGVFLRLTDERLRKIVRKRAGMETEIGTCSECYGGGSATSAGFVAHIENHQFLFWNEQSERFLDLSSYQPTALAKSDVQGELIRFVDQACDIQRVSTNFEVSMVYQGPVAGARHCLNNPTLLESGKFIYDGVLRDQDGNIDQKLCDGDPVMSVSSRAGQLIKPRSPKQACFYNARGEALFFELPRPYEGYFEALSDGTWVRWGNTEFNRIRIDGERVFLQTSSLDVNWTHRRIFGDQIAATKLVRPSGEPGQAEALIQLQTLPAEVQVRSWVHRSGFEE
jgi:hypothetical protein